MSNLTDHAERELKRAGLFDKNSDYGGMLGEAVMALVRVHAEQGHSGFSHALTMDLFNRVANFKTLTPITSAAEEWGQVADPCESEPTGLWQNKRQSSVFSRDGGTTWYDIDAPKAPADSPTDDDDDVLARSGFGGGSSAEPKADAAPPQAEAREEGAAGAEAARVDLAGAVPRARRRAGPQARRDARAVLPRLGRDHARSSAGRPPHRAVAGEHERRRGLAGAGGVVTR